MDDGSQSVEMSLQMLQKLRLQNVGKVIATPHYYPYKEDVASFLKRREVSHKSLSERMVSSKLPEIELGAEVHLSRGLSKENLSGLCTESGTILLELPFRSFKTWMMEEIENITYQFSVTPIIAHIERYLPLYQKEDFQRLLSFEEAVWQINNCLLYTSRNRSPGRRRLTRPGDGMARALGNGGIPFRKENEKSVRFDRTLFSHSGMLAAVLTEPDALGILMLTLGASPGISWQFGIRVRNSHCFFRLRALYFVLDTANSVGGRFNGTG